jgi:PAS domain S-box-containing protein
MAMILAVDDRSTNRDFLVTLLTYRGHSVLQAADGTEALAVLVETPVDLVVTDILMPTMDGYELVRRMREEPSTAKVPVIFFTTSYNQREARHLAEACGVARVLTKPADAEVVLEAVDQVLSSRLTCAGPPPEQFDQEHLQVVNDKLVAMTGELRCQAARMSALLEISLQLACEHDPEKLHSGFCRAARDLVAARHVVVAVHAADRGPISYVTVSGMPAKVAAELETALKRDGAFTDMIAAPRTLRRTFGDGDPALVPREYPAVETLIAAPIRSLAHVYGWICATGKLGLTEFTQEDEQLLEAFAAQVGRIYENSSLNAELRRQADDLRHAVAERRLAERQSDRIFETSQDLILVSDGQGKLLQASPSSLKVLGYRPEEMIGQSGAAFAFPDDLEAARNEMRAARRGTAVRHFRCRHVHKDGRPVALDWMAVWSEPDREHYFIGRDMTDYDHTEQQLRQAQKMEAVGQLTGGVAHDFNNILMVIMANIENLQEDGRLHPELGKQVGRISDAALRAADLTRQLLAFSRKQALLPRPTNINQLVSATAKLLHRTLGEQVQLELSLAGDVWDAEVDRAQLDSAIVNLCINARDAMSAGGRLVIETRNATRPEDLAVLAAEGAVGAFVMLKVTDTGAGIPAGVLARVFEPFFTTKAVGKGTGLGLSMVYGFIKQSKGHVRIDSEVGRGTSIALFLPKSTLRQGDAAAGQRAPVLRGKEQILVVEDDEAVRVSVLSQLRSLGYAASEAADGDAALAAFQAASRPFDLLLTDMIMPGMVNGKALADEVKRRWPNTCIIFMTGYAEDPIIHHGRLDAGVLLLNKPFRKSELAQAVRQVLDGTSGSGIHPSP